MSALWTHAALLSATGGRAEGPAAPPKITGVSIDSRTLSPGEAFFAITGDRLDGHDYVADALARGAGLAVVSEARSAEFRPAPGPLVIVPDVLEALRKLGAAARARTSAKVIGITGSVGKTGTKEALRLALERSGPTHASAASYNNHWGVPLSLARMPEQTAFGVFEMGMNAPGEIAALTALVRPDIAVITTVAPVHLEFFGSVERIADAKAEILEGVAPGGVAILNADNAMFARLSEKARARGLTVVSFAENGPADARADRIALHPDCSCVVAEILGTEVAYKLGAPGRHLVGNSLAVLAAAKLAGGDFALAALALADLRAPKGRGARLSLASPDGEIVLIDESYNANPASMRAALDLLGASSPGFRGRRIAVLGDMLELGDAAEELHRELAEAVEEHDVDLLFAAGSRMRHLWDELAPGRRGHYAAASDGLVTPLLDTVRAGDVVMVKGSLGSRMGPIVEALKNHFAARESDTGIAEA